MSDALFDGRPFRLLTVVDCHTRESLAIVPRTNFKAFQVVDVLNRLAKERGKPTTTRCDNGPEFAGRKLSFKTAQISKADHPEIVVSNPRV